ncbi:PDZ domain-containing protein [Candidatus Palauibacter sp.]|uniref:PDZ domain-containing protein n=1 Tax=Candidatus Palauibacter sp. TaxID=3101350 RepID=UPI003AF221E7
MKRDSRKSLAVGLGMALFAGLWAVVGPAAAQEEEDDRSERVRLTFAAGGGYLGVGIADVDDERASELGMSRPYGVYISDVVEDGPAAEAGVEEGDVILRWNGDRLESVAQLQRLARETPPGRVTELTVLRDGAERELSVELGYPWGGVGSAAAGRRLQFVAPQIDLSRQRIEATRERVEAARDLVEAAWDRGRPYDLTRQRFAIAMRPRLGVSIQSLGEQLAEYFGVEGGALVMSVSEDSPAAEGGLQAGDVIVGIGDEDIADPGDLRETLSELEPGDVLLRVIRDGEEHTLTVRLEERDRGFFEPGAWDFFQIRI